MSAHTIQPPAREALNRNEDRCDRCGAEAYVAATIKNGLELLFCAHHWRDHGQAVVDGGAVVHDETTRLDS